MILIRIKCLRLTLVKPRVAQPLTVGPQKARSMSSQAHASKADCHPFMQSAVATAFKSVNLADAFSNSPSLWRL